MLHRFVLVNLTHAIRGLGICSHSASNGGFTEMSTLPKIPEHKKRKPVKHTEAVGCQVRGHSECFTSLGPKHASSSRLTQEVTECVLPQEA